MLYRYDNPSCRLINEAHSENLDHVHSVEVFDCYGDYMIVKERDIHFLPEEIQLELVEYVPPVEE